jgi:acyl carrier protein
MNAKPSFEAIADLISSQFSVPADRITPQMSLAELALDSIGLVELAALLEDEFDIEVPTGSVAMQDRVGDLVRRLTAGPRPPAVP